MTTSEMLVMKFIDLVFVSLLKRSTISNFVDDVKEKSLLVPYVATSFYMQGHKKGHTRLFFTSLRPTID
jgi:hypothetical protein